MSTSGSTTLLVETSPGHCHGETLDKLVEDAKAAVLEAGIKITHANGPDVWAAIERHHERYSMFPHNTKAKSRPELTEAVFYRVMSDV